MRGDPPVRRDRHHRRAGRLAHHPHTVPMQSLDKVNTPAELLAWEASLQRRLGGPVTGGYVVDVKLDGFAVAARYQRGRLVKLVGRGDGRQGEDWSHAIGTITGLPQ
ncbi:hypothetical protein CP967_01225 [Streptomyces nitrosporeus]|uniref:NAD-dependent DNA ligase adenylation domain-containing protein n=1 Tax=Streptomyces nitrosporeus TaxID=28894 RepID=A0A5J6F376_9ACTN|nr:hypothetical protein CP967_01225 [Streptomyces nitrosporeus]